MMSEEEQLTIIKALLGDTNKYANDNFRSINMTLDDSYNQEPYGNEEDDHSQVVTSDHFDQVESDTPTLARIFLGPNKVLEFKPFGQADREEAQQKTIYADYLIRQQKNSFKVLHDWIKEPGKAKCSVVKFFCEHTEKPEYIYYAGISEDELTLLMDDLKKSDKVQSVSIDAKYEQDGSETEVSVRIKVIKKTKKISIVGVPPECFIISRGASCKEEAVIVGDESIKRKSELIAEGIPEKVVRELTPNESTKGNQELTDRFEDEGGWDYKTGYHWLNEEVTIQNLYVLIDADNDGVLERRYYMKCGEKILHNEPYGIVPYAINSQILMPHNAIGKSRGEQAARYQKEKTAVKRGIMDNIYGVNRPGHAIDDSMGANGLPKVELDDLLVHRINRVVRVNGVPQEAIMPLTIPYVGDAALQIVQYIDSEKAATLGTMLANQGLGADKFYKETATRFEGVEDANYAKIELVARAYAETGFRELYEGVIWTAQHYQDEETEIMVLGQPLIVDPRKWRYEHYCQSCVGLGAGDTASAIENLGTVLQTMLTLSQDPRFNVLVDAKKVYNLLDDITRAIGKPDTSRYYNDPEIPEQMLMPMLEQAKQTILQLQQQVQQDPLANAEIIKANAKIETDKMRTALESDKEAHDYELRMIEMEIKKLQTEADILAKRASAAKDIADAEAQQIENASVTSNLHRLIKSLHELNNGQTQSPQ